MNFDRAFDIVTILFSLLFGATGILTYSISVKRVSAQNTLDLSSAWEKFAAPLMSRLADLETKVIEQKTEIEDLRWWAVKLVKQVIELGGVPIVFAKSKERGQAGED